MKLLGLTFSFNFMLENSSYTETPELDLLFQTMGGTRFFEADASVSEALEPFTDTSSWIPPASVS